MKRTTPHLCNLALCTFALVSAIAANSVQARPPHGQGNPVDRLTSELNLNEAQVVQITSIFEETRALHDEVREKSHESFCSIRAQNDERLMEVLDEEQQLQFAQIQINRSERDANTPKRDRRQGGNRSGPKPDGMDAHHQGPPPDCNT
jgi:hypothetical protein